MAGGQRDKGSPLSANERTQGNQVKRKSAKHSPDPEVTRIAEKVKFWSEQDRINEVLIPRVLRQGELLTKHIAEHEDLPQLLNQVVSDALAKQSRAFRVDLEKAVANLNEAHARAMVLEQSLAEHARQFKSLDERLDRHERKMRNRLVAVAGFACAIALIVAALV